MMCLLLACVCERETVNKNLMEKEIHHPFLPSQNTSVLPSTCAWLRNTESSTRERSIDNFALGATTPLTPPTLLLIGTKWSITLDQICHEIDEENLRLETFLLLSLKVCQKVPSMGVSCSQKFFSLLLDQSVRGQTYEGMDCSDDESKFGLFPKASFKYMRTA